MICRTCLGSPDRSEWTLLQRRVEAPERAREDRISAHRGGAKAVEDWRILVAQPRHRVTRGLRIISTGHMESRFKKTETKLLLVPVSSFFCSYLSSFSSMSQSARSSSGLICFCLFRFFKCRRGYESQMLLHSGFDSTVFIGCPIAHNVRK